MRNLFIVTLILISYSAKCFDQEKINIFANDLMKNGEYYRAITEYKRINSYYPNNPKFLENLINIALCYKNSDHEIETINTFKEILSYEPNNWTAIYNIAKTYHDISFYYESNSFITNHKENLIQSRQDSLLILSAVNDIYLDKINSAKFKFDEISNNFVLKKKVDDFNKLIDEEYPLRLKKKSISIFLSTILPGGGYFYTNKIGTGFSALIVNGLLLYATISSFKNDNNSIGILSGIGFTSFYLGSIYGSIQAVNNYNKSIRISFTHKFKL